MRARLRTPLSRYFCGNGPSVPRPPKCISRDKRDKSVFQFCPACEAVTVLGRHSPGIGVPSLLGRAGQKGTIFRLSRLSPCPGRAPPPSAEKREGRDGGLTGGLGIATSPPTSGGSHAREAEASWTFRFAIHHADQRRRSAAPDGSGSVPAKLFDGRGEIGDGEFARGLRELLHGEPPPGPPIPARSRHRVGAPIAWAAGFRACTSKSHSVYAAQSMSASLQERRSAALLPEVTALIDKVVCQTEH
jgi:hypothetical protein